MDNSTINAYNQDAQNIAKLHAKLIPHRLYELIDRYFIKGKASADIGCGIGRDTNWLNQQGFPCIGIDASNEMLIQANILYPKEKFIYDSLPELNSTSNENFQNILCSAVLMHLPKTDLYPACQTLLRLLKQNGRLIISFRDTNELNYREKGKLYEPINMDKFLKFFKNQKSEILFNESEIEIKRNLTWHNIVIKK